MGSAPSKPTPKSSPSQFSGDNVLSSSSAQRDPSSQQQPQDNVSKQQDKLKDGPCAETYALLEKCRLEKRIVRNDRALTVCVSETDLLIKCIHRHPAYFQQAKTK